MDGKLVDAQQARRVPRPPGGVRAEPCPVEEGSHWPQRWPCSISSRTLNRGARRNHCLYGRQLFKVTALFDNDLPAELTVALTLWKTSKSG